jgi:hypothetical protein
VTTNELGLAVGGLVIGALELWAGRTLLQQARRAGSDRFAPFDR